MNKISMSKNKKYITLSFPYKGALVNKARCLPDRKFDSNSKYWLIPATPSHFEAVVNKFSDFSVDDELVHHIKILKEKNEKAINASRAINADIEIPGLKGQLMPFQRAGVAYIDAKGGKALVGDDMGLGKTVQGLAYLQLHTELRPALIIVPASLKINWKREAENWLESRPENEVALVKDGKMPLPGAPIIIINYDLVKKFNKELKELGAKALILDECHYIKNGKAQRSKAVLNIAKGARAIIALSGTPILNRPAELWTTINLLREDIFSDWYSFVKRYCAGYKNKYGWVVDGASNLDELQEKLRANLMIRRKKEQVLSDLPDKRRAEVTVEITNRGQYQAVKRDIVGWLREQGKNEQAEKALYAKALVKINLLKQITAAGKMAAAAEWIDNFLETGKKLVVFCHHKIIIDQLIEKYPQAAVVRGSTSSEDRDKAVQKFQNEDGCNIFLGSLNAASVGFTLTAASDVLFLELGWSPGTHDQAEDRCHRIGQKDSVTAWYLLAENTIEDYIFKLIEGKRNIVQSVMGDSAETNNQGVLRELVELLINEGGECARSGRQPSQLIIRGRKRLVSTTA